MSESTPALRNRCSEVRPKMYRHARSIDTSKSGAGSLASTSCLTWRHRWSTGFNSGQATGNHRISMPNSDAKLMLPFALWGEPRSRNRTICQPRQVRRILRNTFWNSSWFQTLALCRSTVPVLTFNTPYNTLLFRLPVMGTQACSPIRAHTARRGGVSLKIVSSRNRMTVRLRSLNPLCSPLLPVAKLVSAEPKHSEDACSDSPSGATLSALCGDSHANHASLSGSGTTICYSKQQMHIPTGEDRFPLPPLSPPGLLPVCWQAAQDDLDLAIVVSQAPYLVPCTSSASCISFVVSPVAGGLSLLSSLLRSAIAGLVLVLPCEHLVHTSRSVPVHVVHPVKDQIFSSFAFTSCGYGQAQYIRKHEKCQNNYGYILRRFSLSPAEHSLSSADMKISSNKSLEINLQLMYIAAAN